MSDQLINCIVTGPSAGVFEHVPTIEVNGRKVQFALDTEITLPEFAVEALNHSSGYNVTIISAEEPDSPPVPKDGDGDGAADGHGGANGGADTFDADAIITGTLAEVQAKLVGLTPEQLDLVAAAEIDREVPRKGVAAMVEEAKKAALAGGE
jgi:hypothetical protein